MEADNAQVSSTKLVSGLIRHIIYHGNKATDCPNQAISLCRMQQSEWSNLGLARSIVSSKTMSAAFTTPAWLNLLLALAGRQDHALSVNLPLQILSLRMLRAVLPSWTAETSAKISFLDKLFSLLGYTALTCFNDATLQHDTKFVKPRVPLTASHSSTVAEECIVLLRTLHNLSGWDHCLNQFLSAKLALAGELLTNGPLLNIQENENEMESSLNLHSGVLAALSLVGGIDSRPRVGGCVTSDLFESPGTVCRISHHGKLVVQLNDSSAVKKISLSHCKPYPDIQFNLDGIPVTENVLDTWANLLGKLIANL